MLLLYWIEYRNPPFRTGSPHVSQFQKHLEQLMGWDGRLALLTGVARLFTGIADFSRIAA